jgi:quercetin dioxygenase-like cupin family protein
MSSSKGDVSELERRNCQSALGALAMPSFLHTVGRSGQYRLAMEFKAFVDKRGGIARGYAFRSQTAFPFAPCLIDFCVCQPGAPMRCVGEPPDVDTGDADMNILSRKSAAYRCLAGLGLVALGSLAATQFASAGECPKDKMMIDATKAVTAPASGVTDTVLAMIDVSKEPASIKDRSFRLRKLVIQPGGVVPWHSHADRPALIYVVEGEVTEYASNCAVPIVHKAGEVATETHVTAHWWKNTGKGQATLLSSDLLKVNDDAHMM